MLYHVMYIAGERSEALPFPPHVNNNNELLYVDSMWWYNMYISNNDEDNIYLSQNIEYVVVVGVVVVLYGIDSNAYLLTSSWKKRKRKKNIN